VTFELAVEKALVWRRLGIRAGDVAAALEREIGAAYEKARAALEPKHAHKLWAVAAARPGAVELANGIILESGLVAKIAAGADAIVAMAATVGPGIDELADYCNARGDIFAMTVADAVGSVAAEELISLVHAAAAAEAEREGRALTRRVSPGYGDFSLGDQPRLLELAGGAGLGITLTENYMMVPRKSVTAVAAARRI
jgi:hypothetical protein